VKGENDVRRMISKLVSNGRRMKGRICGLPDISVDKELRPKKSKIFAFSGDGSGDGRFSGARVLGEWEGIRWGRIQRKSALGSYASTGMKKRIGDLYVSVSCQ
jgi:hypothetical protein